MLRSMVLQQAWIQQGRPNTPERKSHRKKRVLRSNRSTSIRVEETPDKSSVANACYQAMTAKSQFGNAGGGSSEVAMGAGRSDQLDPGQSCSHRTGGENSLVFPSESVVVAVRKGPARGAPFMKVNAPFPSAMIQPS